MRVLVAYASRHGGTRGIAERIAATLQRRGLEAAARPVASVDDVAGYDAVVVGGAAYMFHWLKDAVAFVRRNRGALAARPTWLFSSGPLGTEPKTPEGVDQKVAAMPKELPDLATAVGAREVRVFFGAYHRDQPAVGFGERLVRLMPAARDALPEGDFRDWPEIDAWAGAIADDLQVSAAG